LVVAVGGGGGGVSPSATNVVEAAMGAATAMAAAPTKAAIFAVKTAARGNDMISSRYFGITFDSDYQETSSIISGQQGVSCSLIK
jgi:hypothetical protein